MVEYPPEMSQAPREPGPDEVKYVHTASVYWRAALWTGALIGVLVLGGIGWDTALIRHAQVQNHGTLANTAEIAAAIHSCVTPGQPCFERAQRREAGAVSSINQVVVLAAACGSVLAADLSVDQRRSQIQACIITQLSERKH